MKKPLLLLAAMALATSSFAQTTTTQLPTHRVMRLGDHPKQTPEQRADKHTARLAQKLGLSAAQQPRVRQILLAQAQESQALRAKYPAQAQRPALKQELHAGRDKYKAQLQAVLTADQNAKLTALKQEHHHRGGTPDGKVKVKTKS